MRLLTAKKCTLLSCTIVCVSVGCKKPPEAFNNCWYVQLEPKHLKHRLIRLSYAYSLLEWNLKVCSVWVWVLASNYLSTEVQLLWNISGFFQTQIYFKTQTSGILGSLRADFVESSFHFYSSSHNCIHIRSISSDLAWVPYKPLAISSLVLTLTSEKLSANRWAIVNWPG